MNARVKYRKFGVMKYVGHLDMMRFFQKAIRKAEIPINYSEGFSPHMIMSFAAPLGIGLTSDADYFDIEVPEDSIWSRDDYREVIPERFNRHMVEGIEVADVYVLPEKALPGMAAVTAADYTCSIVSVSGEMDGNGAGREVAIPLDKWEDFVSREEIQVLKKTKKNEKLVDIRPLILASNVSLDGSGVFLTVSQGSAENLKPELVMDAYCAHAGIRASFHNYRIHRNQVYQTDLMTGKRIPLIPDRD